MANQKKSTPAKVRGVAGVRGAAGAPRCRGCEGARGCRGVPGLELLIHSGMQVAAMHRERRWLEMYGKQVSPQGKPARA